jgi:predicted AAA+ superfamily ATPase
MMHIKAVTRLLHSKKWNLFLRDIDKVFLQWKNSKIRQPLLVRGARQVGKSFSVSSFGKNQFDNCVLINFEESPEFIGGFETFDVKRMVDRISILSNSEIIQERTLLFLNEVQECPKAITALRYFYEKLPELHIIAAGSLVEFTLKADDFRMPVGRVGVVPPEPGV